MLTVGNRSVDASTSFTSLTEPRCAVSLRAGVFSCLIEMVVYRGVTRWVVVVTTRHSINRKGRHVMRYFNRPIYSILALCAVAVAAVFLIPPITMFSFVEVMTGSTYAATFWSWAVVALTVGVTLFNRAKISDFLSRVAHRRVDRYLQSCATSLD